MSLTGQMYDDWYQYPKNNPSTCSFFLNAPLTLYNVSNTENYFTNVSSDSAVTYYNTNSDIQNHNMNIQDQQPTYIWNSELDSVNKESIEEGWMQLQHGASVHKMEETGKSDGTTCTTDSTPNFLTKRKRHRYSYSSYQRTVLERQFKKNPYILRQERIYLSEHLELNEKQIKVWFQNKRMKQKKEREKCSVSPSDSSSSSISPLDSSLLDSEKPHSKNDGFFGSTLNSGVLDCYQTDQQNIMQYTPIHTNLNTDIKTNNFYAGIYCNEPVPYTPHYPYDNPMDRNLYSMVQNALQNSLYHSIVNTKCNITPNELYNTMNNIQISL